MTDLPRYSKYFGEIPSIAVITGSIFLTSHPKVLLEGIKAPHPFPATSEADVALPSLVSPSPIEIFVESLIDTRLLLMSQIECDLTMRESSIGELMMRIHMFKLNMMLNPMRGDFFELIEQHNELVNLYQHEFSQHQKKHAEYLALIGQIYSLIRLYNENRKNKPGLIE